MDIPDKAWITIGVIIAALIAALVSFVNLILNKDQKITEFRQQWIDRVRADIAAFLSMATQLPVSGRYIGYIESKSDQVGAANKAIDVLTTIGKNKEELYSRILLSLNPDEHSELIRLIDRVSLDGSFSSDTPSIELKKTIELVRNEGQKVFKNEWGTVKEGEKSYKNMKKALITIFIVAPIIIVLIYFFS